jgi:hypothetical protein
MAPALGDNSGCRCIVLAVSHDEVSSIGDSEELSVSSLDLNQRDRRDRWLPDRVLALEVVAVFGLSGGSASRKDIVVSRERLGPALKSIDGNVKDLCFANMPS